MRSNSILKAKTNRKTNQTRNTTYKKNNTHNQYGTATIFDLQQQDKAKIGNLIRKVVELDTKQKSTQQKSQETHKKLKKQLHALKSQNNQIIVQHTKLRSKFQQSLKLLQNYQLRLNQMNALKCVEMKSPSNISIPSIDQEKYTKEIQKEINDLKQLIIEMHHKQQLQIPKHIHQHQIHDDVANISPIKTPKLYHQPPAPHPYPVDTKNTMNLAQLRKYTMYTSSPKKEIKNNKTIRCVSKDQLDKLLRIQSGKFKQIEKKQNNNMQISSSVTDLIYNGIKECNNDGDLRRVQSEKTMQSQPKENHYFVYSCDEDIDRLSVYESMDLGITFPETNSDYFSDQEEEDLLIQHLNVLPHK